MDWRTVEEKLCERAEEVCRHLLPEGRAVSGNWEALSVWRNEKTPSLKVTLGGDKVGVWRDFGGGDGGKTLLSLWCKVRSQPFKVCITEAKQFLGLQEDYQSRVLSVEQVRGKALKTRAEEEKTAWQDVSQAWGKCTPLVPDGPVWDYLVKTRRIEPATLEAFQVREMISNNQWVICFPYFGLRRAAQGIAARAGSGEAMPTWLKFEALDRVEGRKREWTTKAPEKCLWGMQVPWFKDAKDVLICEGEKDALSWASWGCAVRGLHPVSVPFGAKWKGSEPGRPSPNREWLDRCWDWLAEFETVYVAMDGDEPGARAAADIITEIGPRRCRRVTLPEKIWEEEL